MTQSPDEARPRVKGSQTAMAAAYLVAIVLGVCSGLWGGETIHAFADFVSSIFIRLFKFISIPIIAVSIIATLASISRSSESGRIFRHTIFYTLFTTILAATLAAVLYVAMSPANVAMTAGAIAPQVAEHSYLEYIQSVIPDNFLCCSSPRTCSLSCSSPPPSASQSPACRATAARRRCCLPSSRALRRSSSFS